MKFMDGEIYHVYNFGNNDKVLFFDDWNYRCFLEKVHTFLLPFCDMLAYNLMPRQFQFLIAADRRTIGTVIIGRYSRNVFSEGIRNLLSSYAQGINRERGRTGSLFQQNTKATPLIREIAHYEDLCFHYIHQNPMRTNLVGRMEDWEYSSFRDFCDFSRQSICNRGRAIELLGLNLNTIYKDSYRMIGTEKIKKFFDCPSTVARF